MKSCPISSKNISSFYYKPGCDLQAVVDLGELNGEFKPESNDPLAKKTALVFENKKHNLVYYRIVKIGESGEVDIVRLGMNSASLGNKKQQK